MSTNEDEKSHYSRRFKRLASESAVQDRLQAVKNVLGTQSKLAEAAQTPLGTVKSWFAKGSTPHIDAIASLARATGISLDYLIDGRVTKARDVEVEIRRLNDAIGSLAAGSSGWRTFGPDLVTAAEEALRAEMDSGDRSNFVYVRRLDVKASAGAGALVERPQENGTIAFTRDWMVRKGINPDRAEVLTAIGDSMEPTIRDGDLVLIDRSIDRVVDNGIYVIVVAGMVMLKRLQIRTDGSLVIRSDNDRYEPEVIGPEEQADLVVEGRVRWFGRTL